MIRVRKVAQYAIASTSRRVQQYNTLILQALSEPEIRALMKEPIINSTAPKYNIPLPKLVEKFSSQLRLTDLKEIVLKAYRQGQRLDGPNTTKVVEGVVKKNDIETVKTFRSLLASKSVSKTMNLDQRLLDDLVRLCLRLGDVGEALQWVMLGEEWLSLDVSEETHDLMLQAAAAEKSWDLFHYLHEDRRTRGFVLNAEQTAQLITEASNQPFMRWRVVRELLCERYGASNRPSAHTLALGFQTIVRAQQYEQAEALYREFLSMAPSSSDDCALFDPTLFLPLTQTAIRLNKFDLLHDMLENHLRYVHATLNPHSPPHFPSHEKGKVKENGAIGIDEAEWLRKYVSDLLGESSSECWDAPLRAGPAVGSAISWLLQYNHSGDSIVAIWNDFMASLRKLSEMSLVDEAVRVQDALDDALHTISSHGSGLAASSTQLRESSAFLKAVLLSEGEGGRGSLSGGSESSAFSYIGVDPVVTPLRSVPLVHSLITMFTRTQELNAVSTMMSRSLAEGNLVDNHTMVAVLQLFQQNQDHDLVLELFGMYLDITDPRNNPKKFMMRGRSIILNPRIKFVPTHEAISWKLAPQIFRVVMTSFAAKEDIAGILNLLTDTLPARGYLPREGFYAYVLGLLRNQGMYAEAASLYAHSQKVYEEQLGLSRLGKTGLAQGYGVASLPLVEETLRSCESGGLGVTALEVFSSLESAHQRALYRVRPSEYVKMARMVIHALSSPDYIAFVPQFLQSLRELTIAPMVTNELLRAALAGSIKLKCAQVATEVLEMMRAANTNIRDAADIDRVVSSVKEGLNKEEVAEIEKFIESCETLRRLCDGE